MQFKKARLNSHITLEVVRRVDIRMIIHFEKNIKVKKKPLKKLESDWKSKILELCPPHFDQAMYMSCNSNPLILNWLS